jgi:hypothetical protein
LNDIPTPINLGLSESSLPAAEIPSEPEKKDLVVCHWYNKNAVYLNGELVHYGECPRDWCLLKTLGYTVRFLAEIPSYSMPEEYDREPTTGHWRPPEKLEDLERQQRAVAERERQEKISRLHDELRRLENGETW